MTADEQAGQHAVDDLIVTDNNPTDLLANRRIAIDELPGPFFHILSNTHKAIPW